MEIQIFKGYKDGHEVAVEQVDGDTYYINDIEHVLCDECDEFVEYEEAVIVGNYRAHPHCNRKAIADGLDYEKTVKLAR